MTNHQKIRAIWLFLTFESVEDREWLSYCYKIIDRCHRLIDLKNAETNYELAIIGQFLLQELERLMEIEKKGDEDFIRIWWIDQLSLDRARLTNFS